MLGLILIALQRDLAEKGVRIQTVLPAGTIAEFWEAARKELTPKFANPKPAPRYGISS